MELKKRRIRLEQDFLGKYVQITTNVRNYNGRLEEVTGEDIVLRPSTVEEQTIGEDGQVYTLLRIESEQPTLVCLTNYEGAMPMRQKYFESLPELSRKSVRAKIAKSKERKKDN